MSSLTFNPIEKPGDLFNEIADMYGVGIEDNYLSYNNSIVKGQGNRIYLEDGITILIGSTYHLMGWSSFGGQSLASSEGYG